MSQEQELSGVYAVYASMQGDLMHSLVRSGALSPADGEAIIQRALGLLAQAPWQGATTAAAKAGLRDLAATLAAMPPRPTRS